MTYSHDAALKSETEMMNALRAADRRTAELEAALTTIRDTLPLVQDEFSRRVFNVAADVLEKT